MSESQPSTNRAEQRRNTHSEILAAAREAIGEHGFQSTTIRVIAQRAGVAVGTVMAHCGSKEELLFEVFHRDIDRMVSTVLETVPEAPLKEQLIFVAESFLRGYAVEPEVSSEFLEHALWARGEWGQKFELQVAELGKWLGTLFAKSMAKGDIPPTVDVGTTITTFFAIYYFELIIQIKQRFVEVEPGVARLRKQIENLFQGL